MPDKQGMPHYFYRNFLKMKMKYRWEKDELYYCEGKNWARSRYNDGHRFLKYFVK